jgi:hypothetical protein
MSALKKVRPNSQTSVNASAAADPVRAVVDGHGADPVASPAHQLQQVLHDAGYRSEGFRERPMSNAMLVLSVICVYALAMLMMLGSLTA